MSSLAISGAIRIFFLYAKDAKQDRSLLNRLRACLSTSRRQGLIDDIDSESPTKGAIGQSIKECIDAAKIIVLLVSPYYFNSDYCAEVEKHVLERCNAGKACLIPVHLHHAPLENSSLSRYHFFPADGKPVKRQPSTEMERVLVEVSEEIRKAAEKLAGLTDMHSHSETQFSLGAIPYQYTPFFTDRNDILTRLHNYFTSDQTYPSIRTQALTGLAGSGKTQIAVAYAHRYKREYETILWLGAGTHTILQEINRMADLLSFSSQDRVNEQHLFRAFKRWLEHHDNWLLILDELEDFTLLHRLIPSQSNGHVLLTTLSQATGDLAYAVPVTQMPMEDSTIFLLRRAKIIEEQASESVYLQARDIVQEVGGLSLAIDQAGAYIEETGCSLVTYLERYRKNRTQLLARRGERAYTHPASVEVTLSLAFNKVAQTCHDALELLRLFAFLHHDTITREMIEQGAPALDDPLRMLASDGFALDEAIATLLKFSLIQRGPDTTLLIIHRVVQDILIEGLMPRQRHRWAIKAVRLINRVFLDAEFSNWPTCEKYFSQARRCAELIINFQLKQKEGASLLQRLGSYCYQRAYYPDAERYLTTALELYEQAKESDPSALAQTLNNLALLYHKQGKYQEAEERYQRALEIRERLYQPDHYTIAQTLNNLALLYKDWGNYQQAEALFQRVLSIDERTLGPDHPDTAVSLSNLALVYDEQGKYSLAEPLYQRAFSIEEHTLNTDLPDLALSLNTQAIRLEEQGKYAAAEMLYLRALAIQEQSLGPDHPDTALSLANLANLYETLKKYQEAETLYRRALDNCERALIPEHPDIAVILNNLAYLLRQQGRYAEAEGLYKRALTIYEQIGPEHPDTANALNNLGQLYHLMQQDELAELLLRRGLDIRERMLGLEHFETGRSLITLAELLIHQQLYEQAEPLYRRFLKINQQTLGPEHPDVTLAQEQYTRLLERISEQRKP